MAQKATEYCRHNNYSGDCDICDAEYEENKLAAVEIGRKNILKNNSLFNKGMFLRWNVNSDKAILDGEFEWQYLWAIAIWMKNNYVKPEIKE